MKCYIYVTKSEPYLWKYRCVSDNFNGIGFETSYSKKEHDSTDDGEILNGKIVASFDLNKVEEIYNSSIDIKNNYYNSDSFNEEKLLKNSCLTFEQLDNYLQGKIGYAWHIDNLEILEEPLELSNSILDISSNFYIKEINGNMLMYQALTKAPKDWCYAEYLYDHDCIITSINSNELYKIINENKKIIIKKNLPKEFK